MGAEPSRRDEFLPTLGRCLLGMAIAIILGCFIGYGCLLMIGQDSDLTISNRYLDRVAAARSCFAAQGLEYQQAADALRVRIADLPIRVRSGMDGLIEAAELDGVDTVVTAVVGMVALHEPVSLPRVCCLLLVVAGVVGLKLFH